MVIGGLALTLHGSKLLTADIDVIYDRSAENAERLARVLAELDVRLPEAPDDLPFRPDVRTLRAGQNFTFSTRYGALDLLGEVAGIPGYDHLRQRAQRLRIGRRSILVASIDDLIAMKAAAGRPKDLRALDDLEELRNLE